MERIVNGELKIQSSMQQRSANILETFTKISSYIIINCCSLEQPHSNGDCATNILVAELVSQLVRKIIRCLINTVRVGLPVLERFATFLTSWARRRSFAT
jgi:hypothetical protein